MDEHRLRERLKVLAERGIEPPRPTLVQKIKDRIPDRIVPHRMDTVKIIVDFRISRMGAAAAIVFALIIAGGFFGVREGVGASVLREGKLFLKYKLVGETAVSTLTPDGLLGLRDALLAQGRDVTCYTENLDEADASTILMYWRVADDEYCVVMGDLSAQTVSGETLIRLQTCMLQKQME